MAEFAFKICYVEGRQNVVADYLPSSVGSDVIDEEEKGKLIIELYFCEHARRVGND